MNSRPTPQIILTLLSYCLVSLLYLSAAPAAEKEDPSRLINVKEAGAIGDGAADDTSAFQKSLDALAKTGGTLFVPAGNYRITKTLLVTGTHASPTKQMDSIEIRGESQMVSRLLGDGVPYLIAAQTVLDKDKKRSPIFGFNINRLTLSSYNKTPETLCGGINATYMIRWSCRQCIFASLKTGIYSLSRKEMKDDTPDSLAIYIIRIQNNVFYACSDYAIKMGRIFDLCIENNEIEHGVGGIAVGWPGDGFDAAANTIRIVDNVIEGLGPGEPAIRGSCWIGGRIVGNYMEANQGGDIELIPQENDGWLRGVTIASNTFQPTQEQLKSGTYGPIKLKKALDTIITGNFTTSSLLLHSESGPLSKGVNITSNILNNPASIGDIKGAKAGNPDDYNGKNSELSFKESERWSVTSHVATVGIHSVYGLRYQPSGQNARSISYGSGFPKQSSLYHEIGDLIINTNPKVNENEKLIFGWICIKSGDPGGWKTLIMNVE